MTHHDLFRALSPNMSHWYHEITLKKNMRIFYIRIECFNESIDQGRSFEQQNIEILDCFFKRLSVLSESGGVICINGGSYNISVQFSTFYNCSSNQKGGAIFFVSLNCNLRMICANKCYAGTNYHFSLLKASIDCQIDYISLSSCSYQTKGNSPMALELGNQFMDNCNDSMNNAVQVSGIEITNPTSFLANYCTFSINNASQYVCIWFWNNPGKIKYSNINNNNSPSGHGIIYSYGGFPKMQYCIFDSNQNTLFSTVSGLLEVSDCSISHIGLIFTYTPVTTSNSSIDKKPTYQIEFFSSRYCIADNPIIHKTLENTLIETPIVSNHETPTNSIFNTPIDSIPRTYDENQKIYYECSLRVGIMRNISVIFGLIILFAQIF